MILVTIGTASAFDALIRAADELVGGALGQHRFVAQIARGEYLPKHMEYFRYDERIAGWWNRADVIVGHGGTGTVIETLKAGKPFVAAANPSMADNHQAEFLEALDARRLLVYCRDITRLGECIATALTRPPPTVDTTDFGRRLADFVAHDGYKRSAASRRARRDNGISGASRGMGSARQTGSLSRRST